MTVIEIFLTATTDTAHWVWRSISMEVPWYQNYFWGLTVISICVYTGERLFPWRKNQKPIRDNFWQDAIYMYFNFFAFSIAISGIYKATDTILSHTGITVSSVSLIKLSDWPIVWQLLVFFILLDFMQWITHIALHRIPFFWRFHQIHHSTREMGFAAHLRYHWMENILYKPLKTLGLMLIGGFEPQHAYAVHFLAITIGHLNHANIKLSYGPLKYIFNNPVMHLYHHAYTLPHNRQSGINFGLSLSIWDYLFKTAYVPEDSGSLKIGFDGDKDIPPTFLKQLLWGFTSNAPNKQ